MRSEILLTKSYEFFRYVLNMKLLSMLWKMFNAYLPISHVFQTDVSDVSENFKYFFSFSVLVSKAKHIHEYI